MIKTFITGQDERIENLAWEEQSFYIHNFELFTNNFFRLKYGPD